MLVSSGFTVPFKSADLNFFKVNSPESGLLPFSEELIYRFMEMFEMGESCVGKKFPEWELHPQSQGTGSALTREKGAGKVKHVRVEWAVVVPGLPRLWESSPQRHPKASGLVLCLYSKDKHLRQFTLLALLLGVLRMLKHGEVLPEGGVNLFSTFHQQILN